MNYKSTLSGLFCFFLLALNTLSANDEPCSATGIIVNASCSSTTFSNATSTNTISVPDPACAGYNGGDIWFQFTMPEFGYHTVVELSAGTMIDGGMAVYSGSDCSNLTLVSCDDNSGPGDMPLITVDDGCGFEFAGETFWVRVWENGNDNNGTFDICAYTTPGNLQTGVSACGSNLIAGNACCDALLLGADLDGYCGNTANYTDEPDEIANFCAFVDNNAWLAFVASETTVDIGIVSSNCVSPTGNGIQVAILETSDCTNFNMVSNCWNPGTEASGNLVATGLTIGETYYIMVDGWAGDECDYTLSIVSGVETASATADDEQICQGASTQLHANVVGAGPFSYNWAPAGSLDDPTSPNPIATPNSSTTYSVTISGGSTTVQSVSVTVYNGNPVLSGISGPSSVCENSTDILYTATATDAGSYNWTLSGSASISSGAGTDSLYVNFGNSGGSVCVEAVNDCGLSSSQCVVVSVNGQPDISATDPDVVCAPDEFDLNTIVVNNNGSAGGFPTYYDNLTDALAGTNDLLPATTSTSGTYYIRVESGPDCYSIDSVEIEFEDPELVIVNPGVRCSPQSIDLDDVTINEVNGFPGGTKTYYTDSLDAAGANNQLSSTEVFTGGTYWVRYETPGGCFEIGAIEVSIDVTPDITVDQPAPLCPGGAIDLDTITLIDANSSIYTKTFYSNITFANLGVAPLTNTVVSMPQSYYLRAETANNCFQIVEIIIVAGVTPDATITGGGTFCQGENADITFSLNGSGPFDVVYTDGTQNFSLNSIADNYIEQITVSVDSTFSLVSVTDANGCTGNLLGSNVNITANPAPTGEISGDTDICSSGTASINFAFTGNGPFDIEYSDGTNVFTETGLPANHTVSVTVNSTTTFTLISVTDSGSCPGTISGSATINIIDPIEITNIAESCDASFTMYTVSFEIINGDPSSYNVTGDAGTLVGNVFTSDPIASGTPYSFTVADSSPCPSETISGNQNCSCATDAGTMDLTLIEVCEDETATATFITGSNTLNPGDLFRYVIHDNSGAVMGNSFGFSDTPEFGFQTGMILGTTYYISPIAGPDDGFGQVDFSHTCFSISQGTPVVFHELPEITISGDTTICEGESTFLTFDIIAGTEPFNITIASSTGPDIIIENVNDGDTYNVSPSINTTYTISEVEDNTTAQCNGTGSGSATINVLETVQVSNVVESCDASFTMYTVSFEITGGITSGYSVSGGSGTITGNTFTSDPIASGTPYSFTVTDGSSCPGPVVSGMSECTCTTDAGTMDLTSIDACEDETAIATFNNGSNTLSPGDVAQFVLHDNPGATLGNVIALSATPEFSFGSPMVLGTTYYISPIAGPNDGSGDVDQNHICFSISPGTPVVFYDLPEATILGDANICMGGTSDLTFNFSAGIGPFEITIEDQNSNQTIIPGLNDGDVFSVMPTNTSTYTIVNVMDSSPANCIGSGTGSAVITVNESPQVSNIQFVCNNINTQYQVSFELSGGDPSSYSITGDPGVFDNMTNTFLSDPIDNGVAYSFQIDDTNLCGPVDVIGNYVCDCTSNAGEMDIALIEACEDETANAMHLTTNLNLDGNDVLGFILYDQTSPLPGSVMLTNSTPNFDYDASLAYGITYFISAVVGDDDGTGFPVLDTLNDPCLSISNGQPVIFFQEPEVSISGTNTICQGDSTDIVFDFVGDGTFNVIYNDGVNDITLTGIDNGYTLRVGPGVTTTYTLVSVELANAPFCDGIVDIQNDEVIIEVIEIPVVSNINADCNELGTSYTITFEINGGNPAQYNVSGNSGTLTGNTFTSDPLPGGSTYNFQVDDGSGCPPVVLTATEYCNCTPDIKPVISFVEAISCFGESDGVLSVINENGVAPFSFEWSSGATGDMAQDLASGWQTVTMTDGNNCTSIDSIFLDEPAAITAELDVIPLVCYGDDEGEITFFNVQGGAGDYTYSLDYNTTYIQNTFYDLPSGAYEATVMDADGCTWVDTVTILEPAELIIDLGDDITIELGDSILVNPDISLPIDSFTWEPGTLVECSDCLDQMIHPNETNSYSLFAMTEDGCTATDEISIIVEKERPVFIPNIFTPNGDGDNDILRIYSGGGITFIHEFRIYDRWGALVYEVQDMVPGNEDFGWDGKLKGEDLVQGVYVYFLKVDYLDGTSELITGDVTIIR